MQASPDSQLYLYDGGVEAGHIDLNRFVEEGDVPPELLRIDEGEVRAQMERVKAWRADRDQAAVDDALALVRETAGGTGNLLHPMKEAVRAGATLGEVSDTLRTVFGEYRPSY